MINITKDLTNKALHIVRDFNAPVEKVWQAWTDSNLLDKWWGPKPWRAETKTMDFSEGGFWLYAMVGPDGSKHWNKVTFKSISAPQHFASDATFTDEHGIKAGDFPVLHWSIKFQSKDSGTEVIADITFDDVARLEQIVAMGFEGGFTMGLNQLEELLGSA